MRLKNHLNFKGDKEKKEISFHYLKGIQEDVIMEVDDFDKIWSYLLLLSDEFNDDDLAKWKEKYHVSEDEKEEIDGFLVEQGMVYLEEKSVRNTRLANFLGNVVPSSVYGESNELFCSKTVLVVGLGTVGSALVDDLLQFGVRNYILIDNDKVEESNIAHQRNYTWEDIGRYKSDVIEERIKKVDSECKIKSEHIFVYKIEDILNVVKEEDIDAVFWCIDQYDSKLLQEVYKWSNANKLKVYMAGYITGGYVAASLLTRQVFEEMKEDEKNSAYRISSNSGIGILGDISAALMVRLWIQDVEKEFDLHEERLGYNFVTPLLDDRDIINEDDIAFIVKKYQDADSKGRAYMRENIIFPYLLMLYSQYMTTGIPSFEDLSQLCRENEWDFLDEDDEEAASYLQQTESLSIAFHGEKISLSDFANKILEDRNIEIQEINEYKNKLLDLKEQAMKGLKRKKQKYFEDYLHVWGKKKNVKEALIQVARAVGRIIYHNELDYLHYKPYSQNGYEKTVNEELNIIKQIDIGNGYTDFTGFINYIQRHNFLHITDRDTETVNIFNPRYGMSDIIVSRKRNWQEVFALAHEIGHAYYYSLIQKGLVEIDELTAEVLSMLTEFQVIRSLERNNCDAKCIEAIQYKLQGVFLGMFSLDIYGENVLRLEEIKFASIKQVRENLVRELMGNDFKVKNETYSQNNILLNEELLFM